MDDGNPFSRLFSSVEEVRQATEIARTQRRKISDILTKIFLITINQIDEDNESHQAKCGVAHVILLPQLCRDDHLSGGSGLLKEDNIAQGLAERLQLTSHTTHLVDNGCGLGQGLYSREMAVESSPLDYLAHAFARANREKAEQSLAGLIQKCKHLIGEMAGRVALVHHQRPLSTTLSQLLIKTLSQTKKLPLEFFYSVADSVVSTSSQSLAVLFTPAVEKVFLDHHSAASLTSQTLSLYYATMDFFSCNASLAKLLVDSRCWSPPPLPPPAGNSFQTTLIGKLLCPSPLALTVITPSEHFAVDRPLTPTEVKSTTSSIHVQLTALMEHAQKIISKLLRVDAGVKRAVIKWLVDCYAANSTRSQMAYRYQSGMESILLAGDGFFLNLNWLLLSLCQPFMVSGGEKSLARLVLVEPSYCSPWTQEQCSTGDSIGPLVDFSQETKLVSRGSDQVASKVADMPKFQFMTHCFFLTHKSLILGMTQVVYKLEDRIRTYLRVQEAVMQMGFPNTNHSHPIVRQYLLLQSQVLGLRAHAMHPDLLNLALCFHASTAHWLVSSMECSFSLPHPHADPSKLKDFPECLVDNMATFAIFLRQSDSDTLYLSSHLHEYFITFSTIFMGSSSLVHNPHIRAKLAQLVLLIAGVGSSSRGLLPNYSDSQRQVFADHSVATLHLLPALMTIFIDIEFTGESMEFEDKFQYRLPMYDLLEFLWTIPSYRPCIDALEKEVCESSETPLFLRYINMIINDATVQLDEGLENLAKVKQLEDLMASSAWADLSDQDKKDNQHRHAEARMMARNRCLLAQKTMEALSMITNDTWRPFVVESIVQRMANMLNYVLKLLVGAKSRELKVCLLKIVVQILSFFWQVRDARQLNFKPDELVCAVVTVYVNLGKEDIFCEALLRDGRSFSMELFAQARRVIAVLNKPNSPHLITELTVLEEKVKQNQIQLASEQEAYDDPPEEFLDPITQEIMSDPVKLPTSGETMDRSNILRHLLSDQTDPFNRAPLTPDMLISDIKLKDKIQQWKKEQTERR